MTSRFGLHNRICGPGRNRWASRQRTDTGFVECLAGGFFDGVHHQQQVGIQGALHLLARFARAVVRLVVADRTDVAPDGIDVLLDVVAVDRLNGLGHLGEKAEQGATGGFSSPHWPSTVRSVQTPQILFRTMDSNSTKERSMCNISFPELKVSARGSPRPSPANLLSFATFGSGIPLLWGYWRRRRTDGGGNSTRRRRTRGVFATRKAAAMMASRTVLMGSSSRDYRNDAGFPGLRPGGWGSLAGDQYHPLRIGQGAGAAGRKRSSSRTMTHCCDGSGLPTASTCQAQLRDRASRRAAAYIAVSDRELNRLHHGRLHASTFRVLLLLRVTVQGLVLLVILAGVGQVLWALRLGIRRGNTRRLSWWSWRIPACHTTAVEQTRNPPSRMAAGRMTYLNGT